MSILSWNCRGLGNLQTIRDLCRMVKEKKPNLVFLMEIKLRAVRMESIKAKLGFDCVFTVDCVGRSGGLALLWMNEFGVTIQNFSRRHVNAVIRDEEKAITWKFTGFYEHPDVA
jgi:exonuclease III